MFIRTKFAMLLTSGAYLLAGCATSINSLRIALIENPNAIVEDSPRVIIDDARPWRDRVPHRGGDISRCERWFGDDTFTPSKLAYLDKLIAERTHAERRVHIRLTRFAVTEYCEFTASGNSTGAARVAGGLIPGFSETPVIGDTVVIRLAGEIDGRPFDVSREFDYGTIYRSPHQPSSYLMYRMLLRDRLEQIVDEIVGVTPSFWRTGQK
jgi:hypothetical protein